MSDLTPEDRALLDRARGAHEPTPADRTRVRAALIAGLGAGASLTVTTTATSAAGASLVTKVFAALVVAVAAGGGGVAAYHALHAARAFQPGSAPQIAVLVAPTAGAAAPRNGVAAPGTAPPPMAQPMAADLARAPTAPATGWHAARGPAPDAPAAHAPTPAAGRGMPAPAPTSASEVTAVDRATSTADAGLLALYPATTRFAGAPAAPSNDTTTAAPPAPLARELVLIRTALLALDSGDALGALALYDQHAREFPNGVLSEDRDAERVLALCALRRLDEARAAGSDFLRAHARSVLAPRVRASCGGSSNP